MVVKSKRSDVVNNFMQKGLWSRLVLYRVHVYLEPFRKTEERG